MKPALDHRLFGPVHRHNTLINIHSIFTRMGLQQTIREGLVSIEDQKCEILREDRAEECLRGY